MNIAIGTIVFIFLLVVPNTIFRRFFYTGPFSLEYFKPTPFLSFISSIVPGFLLHISFIYLILTFFPKFFDDVHNLYMQLSDKETLTTSVSLSPLIKGSLIKIFHYNIFLWAYVMILSVTSKALIRRLRLDRKIKLFRFRNNWHYIFSGEILDFPYIKGKTKNISFTYIDIMVGINGGTLLYSGLYYDHIIAQDGFSLESISISEVSKRFVGNTDEENQPVEKPTIPGDFILIPAKNIINMNVSYYHIGKQVVA